MPTLRIMPDGRPIYASPGATDSAGVPSFSLGGGETNTLAVDYTSYLGVSATIASSDWATDGGTLTGTATAGAVVSAMLAVPVLVLPLVYDYALNPPITVRNVMTASDGRVCRTTFRVYPEPR